MHNGCIPATETMKVENEEILQTEYTHTRHPQISVTSNLVSVDTQNEWKVDTSDNHVLPVDGKNGDVPTMPKIFNVWSSTADSHIQDQKDMNQTTFSQQLYSVEDEEHFQQLDYKTRNRLKTKQRRQDPLYRSQERNRQKTVMRLKRQDPGFRAVEREKGRYRMRVKRLDPMFRSQERERQRERMKMKRSNPEFREREREQQKTRLFVKRLDSTYKEKERTRNRKLRHERRNSNLYSLVQSDKNKIKVENSDADLNMENQIFKCTSELCYSPIKINSGPTVFPENFCTNVLSVRHKEPTNDELYFKKHALNFNFYSTGKEQWVIDSELNSKLISHFNATEGQAIFKALPITDEHSTLLKKEDLFAMKNTLIKIEHSDPSSPVDYKSSQLLLVETEKSKSSDTTPSSIH